MAMPSTLEDAVERLSVVPQDIRRYMELLKDLDTQWVEKFTLLKREQQAYVTAVQRAVKVRGRPSVGDIDASCV